MAKFLDPDVTPWSTTLTQGGKFPGFRLSAFPKDMAGARAVRLPATAEMCRASSSVPLVLMWLASWRSLSICFNASTVTRPEYTSIRSSRLTTARHPRMYQSVSLVLLALTRGMRVFQGIPKRLVLLSMENLPVFDPARPVLLPVPRRELSA